MVFFSVIAIPYRYGSEVTLNNTYIHFIRPKPVIGYKLYRKWRFGDSGSTLISVNVVAVRRTL